MTVEYRRIRKEPAREQFSGKTAACAATFTRPACTAASTGKTRVAHVIFCIHRRMPRTSRSNASNRPAKR